MSDTQNGGAGCGPGMIRKSSFHRESYTRKDGVHVKGASVPSVCVPHKGKRMLEGKEGKTPKAARVLPKLKEGELSKFGYSSKKSSSDRHSALDRAAKANGARATLRHLVAASNYLRYTVPSSYKTMREDVKYLEDKYFPGRHSKKSKKSKRSKKSKSSRK